MRVLLRNSKTDRYYAGLNQWETDRGRALDLENIDRAIRVNQEHNVGATDLILAYDKPLCTLTVPIASDEGPNEVLC